MADEPAPAIAVPFSVRTAALSVLTVVVALPALKFAEPVLVPVLASLLFAYALEPAVTAFMYLRLPRSVAAVLVFGLTLTGVQAGGRVLLVHANALARDLPETVATIRAQIADRTAGRAGDHGDSLLDDLRRAAAELEKTTTKVAPRPGTEAKRVTVVRPPIDVAGLLVDNGVTFAAAVAYGLVIAVLTFLLLATGDLYKRKLVKLAGNHFDRRKITIDVLKNIDRQIERYLVVRLAISAIVAALTALALWPLGLRHWLVWGVVAGILNVIPFIGPSIAVGSIALGAFLQFKTLTAVALAGGLSGLVAVFEGNVLSPWLTGRAGELNTVAVFVGVLFWGWLWGVWGLVLAVPLLVVIKAAADHIEQFQAIGELLGR